MKLFFFILALILIIAGGFFLSRHSFRLYGGFTGKTKFSPDDIVQMVEKYSPAFIAGECQSKDFVMFKNYSQPPDEQPYTSYAYYFVENNPSEYYLRDEAKCEKEMYEKLATTDNVQRIYYSLKNKKSYKALTEFLVQNKQEISPQVLDSIGISADSCFLYQNCLFIDKGFNLEVSAFTISALPLRIYLDITNTQRKEELNKARADSLAKIAELKKPVQKPQKFDAYIAVNQARVYEQPETYYRQLCILDKGTGVKIIKKVGEFCYCDVTTNDGYAVTGYVKTEDLKFKHQQDIPAEEDTTSESNL